MTSQEDFVRDHEGRVRSMARRIALEMGLTSALEDLIGYGMQGLLEARAQFDPNKGVPFAGFAHDRIRGAIIEGAQRVRGTSRKVRARVARKADAILQAAAEEHAKEQPEEFDALATSLDALYGKFTGSMLVERIAAEERTPEDQVTTELERARVRRAVAGLPDEERRVLLAHYFDERPLDDIAGELGCSRATASRRHTDALGLLLGALG